jgi:hypothetical protein
MAAELVALVDLEDPPGADHLVILIPGIRDVGVWINESRAALHAAGFAVDGAQNNFFGVVGFLWPFAGARNRALDKVRRNIREAIHERPSVTRVSFIAHSFGSYMLANILDTEADLFRDSVKLDKVFICGSVLKDSFPFWRVRQRIGGQFICEIGTHDVWPVLAEMFSLIFGSAGTYGFKTAAVIDRYHQGLKHGSFFRDGFLTTWWMPVLTGGSVEPGAVSPKSPWWFAFITETRKIWTGFLTLSVVLLLAFAALSYLFPPDPQRINIGNNPPNALEESIRFLDSEMREQCPLPGWLCWLAPLQPFMLARDYRGMRSFDGDLLRIETCQAFQYPTGGARTTDPYAIAQKLEDTFPQCMAMDPEDPEDQASKVVWTARTENMTPYTNENGDRALLCGCSPEETRLILNRMGGLE